MRLWLLSKREKDIKSDREEVINLGGLHVIGTERHESRRIDNQLRIGGVSHAPAGMTYAGISGITGLAISISERLHGEGLREAFNPKLKTTS